MMKHMSNIKQIQIVWQTGYVQERDWDRYGDILLRALTAKCICICGI